MLVTALLGAKARHFRLDFSAENLYDQNDPNKTRVTARVTTAAFTTVVGFATLLVSRIATILALGLYAAVGFVCLTTVVLTLMPAILKLLPAPRRIAARKESNRLNPWLARIGDFDRHYRGWMMIAAVLFVIPCLWGISRIRADPQLQQAAFPA